MKQEYRPRVLPGNLGAQELMRKMARRGATMTEVAMVLEIGRWQLNAIITNKRGCGLPTAIRAWKYYGIRPDKWLALIGEPSPLWDVDLKAEIIPGGCATIEPDSES